MFVLRLTGVLCLLALLVALALFGFTRDRRYLRWAWRIVQFMFAFAIVVMLLYLFERLVFVV